METDAGRPQDLDHVPGWALPQEQDSALGDGRWIRVGQSWSVGLFIIRTCSDGISFVLAKRHPYTPIQPRAISMTLRSINSVFKFLRYYEARLGRV